MKFIIEETGKNASISVIDNETKKDLLSIEIIEESDLLSPSELPIPKKNDRYIINQKVFAETLSFAEALLDGTCHLRCRRG